MLDTMKGAEPFLLPGGKRGVLLLHGFTGTPAEMRLLGEHLHRYGFTVLAPRLAGHGSNVKLLEHCLWPDWFQSAADGYWLLQDLCEHVSVAGLSMGGILALLLAAHYDIEAAVTMSAPIHIQTHGIELLPPKKECFGKFVPKGRRHFFGEAERYSIAYKATPAAAVHELLGVIQAACGAMMNLKQRLLIVQSKNDHTVRPDSADFLYEHAVNALYREKFMLQTSGHIVTLDEEREKVFMKIVNFLQTGIK